MRILVFSVTPSPYQRDFFRALAKKSDLRVVYFEERADDSPWATATLESWESVMHGAVLGKGRVRCHVHWTIPKVSGFDRVVVNAPLTGITTQRLVRKLKRSGIAWWFWGEELIRREGLRGVAQSVLAKPLEWASGIVAIGEKAREDYRRRFPRQRVENIPYACEVEAFLQEGDRRESSECCRFLFAGQMIERKGVDVLLSAFDRLVTEGLDASLTLVGREGVLSEWMASVSEMAKGKIDYLGFRQPSELPELFGAADVFVLPSRHDGWGVVVNQALAAGMAVIASRASGAGRDLVEDGVHGLHVDGGDEEGLLTAMKQMVLEKMDRMRMGQQARHRGRELAPDSAAENWLQMLEENRQPVVSRS